MPTLTLPLLGALPDAGGSFFTVAAAIAGVGFLIFVHELGHFLACRATGTRVETFSLGFGPRLFGWERYEGRRRFTVGKRRLDAKDGAFDWRISAIPLGGYVKMAGEIGGDGTAGSLAGDEPRKPLPDELPAKGFWARAFIIVAGVVMNAVSAVVLFAIAYGAGLEETQPLVGGVLGGGPAWDADLRAGDRVISVGGTETTSFESVKREIVYASRDRAMDVVVERQGARVTLSLTPVYSESEGYPQVGVEPSYSWTVDDGSSPAFTIGPSERVDVDGRLATGGGEASSISESMRVAGRASVRMRLLDRPGEAPREVRFPAFGKDAKKASARRLGVVPGGPAPVGKVRPGSAAEKAGLRPGDRIVAVDGTPVVRLTDLDVFATAVVVEVERDGKPLSLAVGAADGAATSAFFDAIAFDPKAPLSIAPEGTGFEGGASPAGAAGLRAGDVLLSIDGKSVATFRAIADLAKKFGDAPVVVRVRDRDGAERDVRVAPALPFDTSALDEFFRGRLEIPKAPVKVSGPLAAVGLGATRAWGEIRDVFRTIGSFVSGSISADKNLGGPGTIVNLSSKTVRDGWAPFLAFLAFISVNLAVLNLLPIPVLDGGSLLLLVIEKARRGKPLKESTVAAFQWAGFALLMLLMVFAIKNDIRNLTN